MREEPFWLLVACVLVNRTTWEAAAGVHGALRTRYGGPDGLAQAQGVDLHEALRPLGLWRRRSEGLVRLARAWLRSPPACARDVAALPGCGRYAADSWTIFVDGRTDVEPDDGKLRWYMERLRSPRT